VPSTPTQPIVVTRIGDWTDHATCRKPNAEDASLFFSPEQETPSQRRVREEAAKAICAKCPVIDPCLRHALDAPEFYGIWGGMNEGEREAARSGVPRKHPGRPKKDQQPAALNAA
jgi:WhiB family redox-sensing transcriptional regulator